MSRRIDKQYQLAMLRTSLFLFQQPLMREFIIECQKQGKEQKLLKGFITISNPQTSRSQ